MLLGVAIFMYASPMLNDSSREIEHKLKNLQPKYNWNSSLEEDAKTNISQRIDATRTWDIVQWTHQCCGVDSPADWLPFRPEGVVGDYPTSCCFTPKEEKHCLQENIWTAGCVSQIKESNARVSLMLISVILINLLLTIIGNLVICCQPEQGYLAF